MILNGFSATVLQTTLMILGWGCGFMDFNTPNGNPIFYEEKFKKIDFRVSSSNVCDENGNYLFACNGSYVEGPNDQLMQNADLLDGEIKYPELGIQSSQAVLIIPFPGSTTQWILFHKTIFYFNNYGTANNELFYSVIDMSKNNANGKMVERRKSLIKDTLDDACLTAVKHANGRDWWVIVSEDAKVSYYIFLVTKNGVFLKRTQSFSGRKGIGEAGQSIFSNDGKYFVSATDDHQHTIYNIYFFTFDRCEGILDNYQYIRLPFQEDWYAGGSFSPGNNNFYFSALHKLYQYSVIHDSLKNQEIIAEYDGYLELSSGWAIPTEFGMMQLAPDGRIYNSKTRSSFNAIHVINKPDTKGPNCNFVQHGLRCTTIKTCLPSFPNYRLGPIDGSVCDSLNIDNIPWAHWRYDQDTAHYLNILFSDLSAYEVEQWCWDFGDPKSNSNTSDERNPAHLFSSNGIYEVCLIVKNRNGSDTLCRTIKIGNLVSTEGVVKEVLDIQFWPNPCKNSLIINIMNYNPEKMSVNIYDHLGKCSKTVRLFQGSNFIDVNNLSPGIYYLSILEKGKELKYESVLKL